MTAPRFNSFEEFWPYYVLEHSKKTTRRFHFAGTSAALGVIAYGLLSRRYKALLLAPLCGYGAAWVSHFFIEKNRPATFDYPAWSLRGDFVMFAKMVRGTMDDEVARCAAEAAQAAADDATHVPPDSRADRRATVSTTPGDNDTDVTSGEGAAINASALN